MAIMFRHHVGQVIREIRQSHGMTLAEMSDFACVSQAYICEVEYGRNNASDEIIEAISIALGSSAHEVLLEASIRFSAERTATNNLTDTMLSVSRA